MIKSTDEHLFSPRNESYASKVFQESTVGIVATLSQTASLRRKAFKILALVLCLIGFFYQSGQFLAAVFQYPTTVDIDIERPADLTVPAYTFCDNNGINRRLFCEKFPERCEMPSDDFCRRFEHYCAANKTLVPKKEFYILNLNMSLEDMIELNVHRKEFVLFDFGLYAPTHFDKENVTGPYLRKKDFNDPSFICYSFNDRIQSTLPPPMVKKDALFKMYVHKFYFTVRSDEMFLPGNRAGILFAVHSPVNAVNPFRKGIFLKPGRSYMIFVEMEEEILLQKPYKTDCVNYTEIWMERGYDGPRTQDMCQQECLTELSLRCFNCVVPGLLYPTEERFCDPEEFFKSEKPGCSDSSIDAEFEKCEDKCKDDCSRVKYQYTVQERFSPFMKANIESEDDVNTKIEVEVYLEGDEIVVLKHSPKYMIVEVFSSIGGFIGCWLGISLLDITDILEGFFRIIRYSCKKISPKIPEKIAL